VQNHFQVHGAIPHGDRAYVSCTDAGMVILDISDLRNPKFISRINWCPPYGGYSHTSLPLPGRGLVVEVCEMVNGGRERNGDKRIWLIDVRDDRQPVMISSFPEPKPPKGTPWESFDDRPLRFGPHNVHENYAGSFQSETLIFSTYFNAGMRITDISNADRPEEVGYFLPPTPPGEPAIQINDLFVDTNNLVYVTDRRSGGLYVVEYTGSGPSRRCSTMRQRSWTTLMPASARARATSSWRMPSCNQTARGFAASRSSRCGGMSLGRRNTSTRSMGPGTSTRRRYTGRPRISVTSG